MDISHPSTRLRQLPGEYFQLDLPHDAPVLLPPSVLYRLFRAIVPLPFH